MLRMRVSTAALLAAVLAVSTGCSTVKMPSFMPTFGKSKTKTSDPATLTNAPPAPQVNGIASQTPVPQTPSGWSNLPMYPGTNYPQTPHATPTVAMGQPVNAPAGTYAAMPADPNGGATPYTPYPNAVAQAPSYTAPAAPTYTPPQAGPYSAPTSPYQAPAATTPSYAQQTAPYTPPANPYAAAANPYTPPANPYAAPPQNAAVPSDNVTR
jgi:hypothetical protein